MIQFEEALKINYVKTTSFHPRSNGKIERMQLYIKQFHQNVNDWK